MSTAARDPGLQPERTSLSWGRTMLAVLVIGTMFLRWIGSLGPLALLPGMFAFLAVGAIQVTQRRRYRQLSRGLELSHSGSHLPDILLLAGAVVLVAASEVVAIVVL